MEAETKFYFKVNSEVATMLTELTKAQWEWRFEIQASGADLHDAKPAFCDRMEEKFKITKKMAKALLEIGEIVKIEGDMFIK